MNNFPFTFNAIDTKSDLFGAAASALCVVHCIATPFIFLAQSCSASCASKPLWWSMIDYLFLAISILAIHHSAKQTSLKWMPTALYISWGVLAFLILNERLHLFSVFHQALYLPAFSLVSLHLYNRKYCQCEEGECCVK